MSLVDIPVGVKSGNESVKEDDQYSDKPATRSGGLRSHPGGFERERPMSDQAIIEIAGVVDPLGARAYLTQHGWDRVDPSHNGAMDVYVLDDAIVHVPTSRHYADYTTRILQLAQTIGQTEKRPQSAILKDLSLAGMDLVRVRLPQASEDHSIPLREGATLLGEAVNLLLAAACAAFQPGQKRFRAGSNQRATECIQTVRLGQTEPGSFVVNLLVPISPSLAEQEPLLDLEPDGRLMTQTLVSGLQAAQEAMVLVNRGEKIAAFEERVSRGITANLCQSVATLIEVGKGLDVSVCWALTREIPRTQNSKQAKATFMPSAAGILHEAATILGDQQERCNERIEGFISALNRDRSQAKGRVTIKAFINNRMRSVTATFPESDYSKITDAHDKRMTVSLEGDLHREGQRWHLESPRNLVVSEDED